MTPRIYDCFCYFNEDMLLELRLETLWDCVDFFVIVESAKTISGKDKPLNFKPDKFAKYAAKIRYLLVESYPFPTDDPWRNEHYQRNFIVNGLHDARQDDLIIVSDIDEIPNPKAIDQFDPKKYLRGDFDQHYYAYYLNNLRVENGEPMIWHGSKIVSFKAFTTFFKCAESVRNYKSSGLFRALRRSWFKQRQVQYIPNGGWHFTWIAEIPDIILKLESFAHQEFNKAEYKIPEVIRQKIMSGLDVVDPGARYTPQKITDELPAYLIGNPDKYRKWLLPDQDNDSSS